MIHPKMLSHYSDAEQKQLQALYENGVDIDNIGGQFPLQAEGNINGVPFYYRARHGTWAMAIGENPVEVSIGWGPGFTDEGEYDDTRYLEVEESLSHIETAVAKYREQAV